MTVMPDHVKDLLREIAVAIIMQNASERLITAELERALRKFDAVETVLRK